MLLTFYCQISGSQIKVYRMVDPESVSSSSVSRRRTKIIRFMAGWHKPATNISTKCGMYKCMLERGSTNSLGADILVFNDQDVEHFRTPPPRRPGDLWAFVSAEPQNHISPEIQLEWDGAFNYSATYIKQSAGSTYSFRYELSSKRNRPSAQDFLQKKKRRPRALWFISHCMQDNRYPVLSARIPYALELSKHFPIDVYTKKQNCKEWLRPLIRTSPEPKLDDYAFYLAFENNLCGDYVSEKFWKVIAKDVRTIPVVLGGLSIKDYERVAPPNSFIHVKNFTSPKELAEHLKFVSSDDGAFNYYQQWRRKLEIDSHSQKEGKHTEVIADAHNYAHNSVSLTSCFKRNDHPLL